MSIQANPYQSAPETDSDETGGHRSGGWGKVCFWGGAGFTGIGLLAMFLRNLPPLGFVLLASVCFAFTSIASKPYRKRAIMGLFLCLILGVGFLFQMRVMHAKLAAQRARQRAVSASQAAERAARAVAELNQSTGADLTPAQ